MTSMPETWTLLGAVGNYEYTDKVKCRGVSQGAPCGKVIGKNLNGSVELKCRHCGHVDTYQNKPVDSIG